MQMPYLTRSDAYGAVAKSFHWLIVVLLAAQYAIGWLMPDVGRNTKNEGLISWHLSFGAAILFVILLRLVWRFAFPVTPERTLEPWEYKVSRVTHALLYALVLVMTLLGWAAAGYRGWDVKLFGAVSLPVIGPKGASWAHTAGDVHNFLQWVLLAFIALHVLGAGYHYFIKRDRLLQRMLP